MANDTVTTVLKDNSVSTAKIVDKAVTHEKLADGAVEMENLSDALSDVLALSSFETSKFQLASSVSELPAYSNTIGWIVNNHLYLYTGDDNTHVYTDCGELRGPQGIQGEKGEKGEQGDKGNDGDRGPAGLHISDIEQPIVSDKDEGINIIRITRSDGKEFSFQMKNGSRGSQGTGISKITQTSTSKIDGGENIITFTLTDGSSYNIKTYNGTGRNKGYYYPSLAALKAAVPNPSVSDWAIVGGDIYVCDTAGVWTNTGYSWKGTGIDDSSTGSVALGSLLTALNTLGLPSTAAYLHWNGISFNWQNPVGGSSSGEGTTSSSVVTTNTLVIKQVDDKGNEVVGGDFIVTVDGTKALFTGKASYEFDSTVVAPKAEFDTATIKDADITAANITTLNTEDINNAGTITSDKLVTQEGTIYKLTSDSAIIKALRTTNITNTDTIKTKNLEVTGSAHFFELIIDKIKAAGGAAIFTPADGFEVDIVESVTNGYKLYWQCRDGNGNQRDNMWKVNDQALCQSFNQAKVGSSHNVHNKYYWCLVTDVSENDSPTLKDGDYYHWIVISTVTKDGTVEPEKGDNIAMLGYRGTDDTKRQSALYISAYTSLDKGLTAPLLAQYRGINDFNLESHRKSYFDAVGSKFVGNFEVEGKSVEDYITSKIDTVASQAPYIGTDGYWYIWDSNSGSYQKTEYKASGSDGHSPYIGEDGYWYTWDGEKWICTNVNAQGTDSSGSSGGGITISSSSIKYAVTTSASQPADSEFTYTSIPSNLSGKYLWSKIEIIYSDKSTTKSYSVNRVGEDGTSLTIKSTSITYAISTSTTQPSSSAFTYSSYPSSAAPGSYVWTKTVLTYSDSTTTTTYSCNRVPKDGVSAAYIYLRGTGNTYNSAICKVFDGTNVNQIGITSGGITFLAINRNTLAVAHQQTYDTYNSTSACNNLVSDMNSYNSNYFLVLVSYNGLTINDALAERLTADGASYVKTLNQSKTPFMFLGIHGVGSGYGFIKYGNAGDDTSELSVYIANGSYSIDSGVNFKIDQVNSTLSSSINAVKNSMVSTDTLDAKGNEILNTVSNTYATSTALTQTKDSILSSVSSTYATKTTTNQLSSAISSAKSDVLNTVSSTYASKSDLEQKADSITSTISSTYSTKTELSSTKGEILDSIENSYVSESKLEQTSNSILAQVNDTYVKIGDGNITLNGDTQVNGSLTLNNDTQGFLLAGSGGTTEISPKSVGTYSNFTSKTTTVIQSGVQDAYCVVPTTNELATDKVYFAWVIKQNLGKLNYGSTVTLDNFTYFLYSGSGSNLSSTGMACSITVMNGSYTLAHFDNPSKSIGTATVRTSSYDTVVSVSFSIGISKSTVLHNGYYVARLRANWNNTIPIGSSYTLIGYNGLATSFGTGKNIYLGSEGFIANFSNYQFKVNDTGIWYNNRRNVAVLSSSSTQTYTLVDPIDTVVFAGTGEKTLIFPKTPYDGQVIRIYDKNDNNGYINTNGKYMIWCDESDTGSTSGKIYSKQELDGNAVYEFMYANGKWYMSYMG